ncbi:MAG: hypothetical protein ACR2PS_09325 [Pseudomonadales bacterium]
MTLVPPPRDSHREEPELDPTKPDGDSMDAIDVDAIQEQHVERD